MGILSRLFSRVAPAPQAVRRFDAAGGGRRASTFGAFGSTGPETLAAAAPVRSRARHAYANNGYLRNAVDAWVAEVVGAGIEATSAHPDTALRPLIDAAWKAAAAAMDAEGRTDLHGLTAQMVRSCSVDGEAFALIEESAEGVKLRQIPAEFVDESDTRELQGGAYVAAGIEFNSAGQRVAYHVRPQRPTDLFPGSYQSIRIEAADVLHLMRPLGPGQVRGVSWLAPVLLGAADLDALLDALLVGTKTAAMFAGFVVDPTQLGQAAPFGEATGDVGDISIEPGVVRILPPGTDIKFTAPQQAADGVGFAKLVLGQLAAGLGLPRHLLDGDLTGANYSSLRAGLLPFRAKVEQFQYHVVIPQMLAPLFRRVVTHEWLTNRIDLPDLPPAFAAEWLPPRPMQVDPLKDAAAVKAQMEMGLTSRRQAVASLGWNVAELDAEISADREREAALGLNFTTGGSDA
jgi:lambda family phage portal protein